MRHFCQCFSMTPSINPDFELDLKEFAWSVLCLSWLSLSLHGNNGQLLFIQHKINSSIRWLYWLDLWWRPPGYFTSQIRRHHGGYTRERGRSHHTGGQEAREMEVPAPLIRKLSHENSPESRENSINALWRQHPRWPPIRLCSSWVPSPPAITYGRPIF